MIGLRIDGRPVLLVNVGGEVRAYDDRCLHRGLPLSQGKLTGHVLVCGAHQWAYDACTGHGVNPSGMALRSYPVRIADGDILVGLDGG
jgi:toluene monooxygenase system ferredoxin subunit